MDLNKSFRTTAENFLGTISASVNQAVDNVKSVYEGAAEMIPDDTSDTDDDEDPTTVKTLIAGDIQKAQFHVFKALESVEPHKSPEELKPIKEQYEEHTNKLTERLFKTIDQNTDEPLIKSEAQVQVKIQLYSEWSGDIVDHARSNFPEAANSMNELKLAHDALFDRYPGKSDFLSFDLSDTFGKREVDAKTLMKDAELKPAADNFEVALGVSALKRERTEFDCLKNLKHFFQTYVPICKWLPEYNLNTLKSDFVAGLTSGVFVIPQAMAYSLLIGVPAKYGLYSAFLPAIIYSILGGCGQLAYGPVAILSLLISTVLQGYPDSIYSEDDRVGIASFLAFMKGWILLFMGLLKFGFLTNFLSQPVLSGFSSAAAVIIIISQLKLIFGTHAESSTYPVVALVNIFASLWEFKYAPFLLAVAAIVILLLIKYKFPTIPIIKVPMPGAMVVVLIGIILLYSAQDLKNIIEIVGFIPSGLPVAKFPVTLLALQNFGSLATAFIVMSLLSFLEMITVGKIFSAKNGYTVDPNGELIASGLANIIGSFFGCFPVTGGFARSPVNASAGAKTQMTGLVCSLVVAIVLLALTGVFAWLPKSILASIIFVAVLALIDTDHAKYLWGVNKSEFALMLITFLVTLGIGPQYGIFISIGLSLLLVLFRSSRPGYAVLGRIAGTGIYRSILDYPEAVCIPGIILFQYQSPLYFMNASFLKKKLISTELLLNRHARTEVIVIDAQAITYIDSVGLTIIDEILKHFHKKNIPVCFANLTSRSEMALERAGLIDRIGRNNLFLRLHDAIRAYLSHDISIPITSEVITAEPAPEADKAPSLSMFGRLRQNWSSSKKDKNEPDISADPDKLFTELEEDKFDSPTSSGGMGNPLYPPASGGESSSKQPDPTTTTKPTKSKKSPPMFLVGFNEQQKNQDDDSSSDSSSSGIPIDPDQTSSSSS